MGWNGKFIKSAASMEGWIDDEMKEVLFVGRSNVGKSSLINALTNNNKMAKVASAPGKTRLLNFFDINNGQFRLVDAPGYGYAKISRQQQRAFEKMMVDYLTKRDNLMFVAMLVDLRREPSEEDDMMYSFLKFNEIPVVLIGTKLDKLKRNDIKKNQKIIADKLKLDPNDSFILTSSSKKENLNLIDNEFRLRLNQGREKRDEKKQTKKS